MNPYAAAILDHTVEISRHEWGRADCALLLVRSLTPAELRTVCSDELNTSHRNLARWARKAEQFPEAVRLDPMVFAYRSHDRKMLEVLDGLR